MSVKRFNTLDDVKTLIKRTDMKSFDIIIVCAALSDYIPKKITGKLNSDQDLVSFTMKKAEKILKTIRKESPNSLLIGFKLDVDEKIVIPKAQQLQKNHNLDYVIANTTKSIDSDQTTAWLVNDSEIIPIKGPKNHLVKKVFSKIESMGTS